MNNEAGFTLIEVLIAMLIATVGLLALAMMQGNAIQGNSYGSRLTQATTLAQARLEQLNSTLLSPNDSTTTNLMVNGEGVTEAGIDGEGNADGPFTLTWMVEENTLFSRKITVTVTWPGAGNVDGESVPHKVVLNSITRGIFYENT